MKRVLLLLLLLPFPVLAQWSPWGLGLIQQPAALNGRNYLGVMALTNGDTSISFVYDSFSQKWKIFATGGGGTNVTGVTNFTASGLSPLFTTSVSNPTKNPALSFSAIAQNPNLFYGGPSNGAAASPTFRALTTNDMPAYVMTHLGGGSNQFYPGQNTTWTNVGGSNQVNLTGTITNPVLTTGTVIAKTLYSTQLNMTTPISDTITITSTDGDDVILENAGGDFILANFNSSFVGKGVGISNAPLWLGQSSGGSNGAPIIMALGLDSAGKPTTNAPSSVTPVSGVSVISSNGTVISSTASNLHFWQGGSKLMVTNRDSGNVDVVIPNPGVQSAMSIVSTNEPAVSDTFSNLHFWAGENITIVATNRNDGHVDLTFAATSGGGSSSGIDYQQSDIAPYSDGTNFNIDFSIPAQTWRATNFALRYSTNWPNNSTSRVANIFIPPTNITRRVYVYDSATNWQTAGLNTATLLPANQGAKIMAQVWTQGETNVFVQVIPGRAVASGGSSFSPLGIPGLTLWLDASAGLFQDAAGTIAVVTNNAPVQRWNDQSGSGNDVTNSASIDTWLQTGAPGFFPCVNFATNATAIQFKSVISNTVAQPVYEFIVFARNVTNANHTFIDGKASAGGTMAFTIASVANNATFQITTGTALNTNLVNTTSWMLVDVGYNSTQSYIATNGVQVATGNIGVGNSAGFTIGASGNFANRLSGKVAEILVWSGSALTAQNITDIRNYLTAKYGPF